MFARNHERIADIRRGGRRNARYPTANRPPASELLPRSHGALYEVATMAPGFAVDEPLATLGRDLKLLPWEEPSAPLSKPDSTR